ncbi:hypothetical protein BJ165DRAFT_1528169 [Panaeolus papilionaceus]|nr:hypothetical protein BJ165DRAFT_1528169 [Panaeolus papilionaceus]
MSSIPKASESTSGSPQSPPVEAPSPPPFSAMFNLKDNAKTMFYGAPTFSLSTTTSGGSVNHHHHYPSERDATPTESPNEPANTTNPGKSLQDMAVYQLLPPVFLELLLYTISLFSP